MLSRRRFLSTSVPSLVGGLVAAPLLAQEVVTSVAAPAPASGGPLMLDVTPEAVDPAAIVLPPDMEGDYAIPDAFRARIVDVQRGLPVNSIHIMPETHHLYFILPGDKAIRYGVAVGQEGLYWSGSAHIGRKVEWPSWRPTDEMIERNPSHYARYADGMPGGPGNPLGARAIYFFQGDADTHIRVHGTVEPGSIGTNASNGCFRMYNSHVIDLYNRVPLGALAFAY